MKKMWPVSSCCDVAEAESRARPSACSHLPCAFGPEKHGSYMQLIPCFSPFEKQVKVQNILEVGGV